MTFDWNQRLKERKMQVLKFGGTSVGSPQRMREVAALIDNGEQKVGRNV